MTPTEMRVQRLALALSQRELADMLGTTVTTVSRLENGQSLLGVRWASHIALTFRELKERQLNAALDAHFAGDPNG
jgi:transcriptional regulator with XRE-family HTH domain